MYALLFCFCKADKHFVSWLASHNNTKSLSLCWSISEREIESTDETTSENREKSGVHWKRARSSREKTRTECMLLRKGKGELVELD